jgi:hypothetical protein
MSVVVSLERTVLLDLCTDGAKLGGPSKAIFRKLFMLISKLPADPHEAIFSAARHSGLKKIDDYGTVVPASDFFYMKFITGYSEDQLETHIGAIDKKISKMQTLFARLMKKTPLLVLEQAAVLFVMEKKQISWAKTDTKAVTKVGTKYADFEKKQVDKRKKADDEEEMLIAGLGREEEDKEAEAFAAEQAWRDVCVQQGMEDSDEENCSEQSPGSDEEKHTPPVTQTPSVTPYQYGPPPATPRGSKTPATSKSPPKKNKPKSPPKKNKPNMGADEPLENLAQSMQGTSLQTP